MAEMTIKLQHPVKVGDMTYETVTIRELTPGDLIEAGLEAERPVLTEQGYELLSSPTLMGVNCLMRQIVKLDDTDITVNRKILDQFDIDDYEQMMQVINALDSALEGELQKRGESAASGEQAGGPDADVRKGAPDTD
ncbi:phage tail assembly protein [uncultured Methylophaga sp.]|uniref:phage tail assembly protein n=1 Tax=uncultured Methylophaga sp. TaxID=285271 RepID=UPI00260F33C3|nr:phage tail assembly protein [uncultured Methylophaga sp.]